MPLTWTQTRFGTATAPIGGQSSGHYEVGPGGQGRAFLLVVRRGPMGLTYHDSVDRAKGEAEVLESRRAGKNL